GACQALGPPHDQLQHGLGDHRRQGALPGRARPVRRPRPDGCRQPEQLTHELLEVWFAWMHAEGVHAATQKPKISAISVFLDAVHRLDPDASDTLGVCLSTHISLKFSLKAGGAGLICLSRALALSWAAPSALWTCRRTDCRVRRGKSWDRT